MHTKNLWNNGFYHETYAIIVHFPAWILQMNYKSVDKCYSKVNICIQSNSTPLLFFLAIGYGIVFAKWFEAISRSDEVITG